jgi:hypothetical protein
VSFSKNKDAGQGLTAYIGSVTARCIQPFSPSLEASYQLSPFSSVVCHRTNQHSCPEYHSPYHPYYYWRCAYGLSPELCFPRWPLIGNYMTNTIGTSLPLIYSWVSANYSGHTKKVIMNAVLLMSFCLGNIIGPLTFTGATAPTYIPAKIAIMATDLVAIAATVLIW